MRGRKPEISADPEALTVGMKPPVWLSPDAKKEWKRVLPLPIQRQILTAGAPACGPRDSKPKPHTRPMAHACALPMGADMTVTIETAEYALELAQALEESVDCAWRKQPGCSPTSC
jgi:hypothetical protein